MPQRLFAAVVLLSLLAAGNATAQSQTPSNGGDLPPLCDVTRFIFSSISGDGGKEDENSPPRPPCPQDEDEKEPSPNPTPRPDPFIPDDPPIRRQN